MKTVKISNELYEELEDLADEEDYKGVSELVEDYLSSMLDAEDSEDVAE